MLVSIRLLSLVLAVSLLLASGMSLTEELKLEQRRATAQIPVLIVSPFIGEKQVRVNCKTQVKWSKIPDNYRTVWLEVCTPDKSLCGGGFPVQNKGAYFDFRPNESMVGQDWTVKVTTKDNRYVGFSRPFFVDGMLPSCCSDGITLQPCE